MGGRVGDGVGDGVGAAPGAGVGDEAGAVAQINQTSRIETARIHRPHIVIYGAVQGTVKCLTKYPHIVANMKVYQHEVRT